MKYLEMMTEVNRLNKEISNMTEEEKLKFCGWVKVDKNIIEEEIEENQAKQTTSLGGVKNAKL